MSELDKVREMLGEALDKLEDIERGKTEPVKCNEWWLHKEVVMNCHDTLYESFSVSSTGNNNRDAVRVIEPLSRGELRSRLIYILPEVDICHIEAVLPGLDELGYVKGEE